jgi:hypothetical protein
MKKRQPYGPYRPVINDPAERERSILDNTPALFEIKRNPKSLQSLDTTYHLWNIDEFGQSSVQKFDDKILKHAQKYNLDPDLTRAVMYAENARGHKLGANMIADRARLSGSAMPMNIQKERWAKLLGKEPEDMYNPDNNIESSTLLLGRIRDRIHQPTPEKIGSIWNYMGKEETTEFGEYIGQIYREKPWKKID